MTPLERAARALTIHYLEEMGMHSELLGEHADRAWPSRVNAARAVIEAIREPSDDQVFAAGDKAKEVGAGDHVAIWQAMIDQLLA